jgi:hypothetical protein
VTWLENGALISNTGGSKRQIDPGTLHGNRAVSFRAVFRLDTAFPAVLKTQPM